MNQQLPKNLRLILSDQLSNCISSLSDVEIGDTILMCEVMEEASYSKPHPKKIAFILATMRHFAAELQAKGYQILYVALTDSEHTGTLTGEVKRVISALGATHLIVTVPSDYHLKNLIQSWPLQMDMTLEVREDHRFLCSTQAFSRWAQGRKQL